MTVTAFAQPYTAPLFTGTAAHLPSIAGQWPAALNGRGFLLDDASDMRSAHIERSVTTLKQQFASSNEPGERSLNPEGAWRRATSSWHHGAGQTHREGDAADPYRFWASKGVNVWTRGQLSLLPPTELKHAAIGSNLQCVSSQGYLYYLDGQVVYRTDLTSRATVTGTPAATATSITSSGSAVFVTFGASGTYKIVGTAATSFVASTMSLVGAAKQRVIGANSNTLYDLSAGTASSLYAHIDTAFSWVAVADGTGHIYAAGNAGTSASIYRITVTDDATALAKPVVAGRLPIGETVTALFGYAGLLFVGTSQGFRVAAQSSSGDLTIGPLVDLGRAVYGFAAWGQYVYFGWSTYDATSSGIGRVNPVVQHADGSFAYASDLMADVQGTVRSVAVLNGTLAFGIDSSGLWSAGNLALDTIGTLDSGIFSFDVTEPKLLSGGSVSSTGEFGIVTLSAAVESSSFLPLNESGFNRSGTWFRTLLTLVGDGYGPTVTSTVVRAFVQPTPSRTVLAPLLVSDFIVRARGIEEPFDIAGALDDIRSLWATRAPAVYQEGAESFTVVVEDYEYHKIRPTEDGQLWCGTVIVKMKVLT